MRRVFGGRAASAELSGTRYIATVSVPRPITPPATSIE
jgi:hypothetical protein